MQLKRVFHAKIQKLILKDNLLTSRINSANLPSHILTRMQSLSASCPFEDVPGSLRYMSMKF